MQWLRRAKNAFGICIAGFLVTLSALIPAWGALFPLPFFGGALIFVGGSFGLAISPDKDLRFKMQMGSRVMRLAMIFELIWLLYRR